MSPTTSAHPSRTRARIGAVVSVVALASVAYWIAGQEAPTLPSSPGDLALIGAAVALYAVLSLLRGWRWDHVLSYARIGHRRSDAYALTIVGYMGNTVLPARGGELLRVFLLAARSHARRREVLGSIVTERMLDAAALFVLFAPLTFAGVAGAPLGAGPAFAALALLAAGVGALAVYLRLRRAGRFDRFASRMRPVARMGRVLLGRGGIVLGAATLGIWLLEGGVLWLVAAGALDLPVDLLDALFLVVLVSLAALVPAAPGYVGTFDAALLFGLKALDVASGDAVGLLLLYRAVIFVPITVAGLGILVARYGGVRSVRRASAAADHQELLAEQLPRERRPQVAAGERA